MKVINSSQTHNINNLVYRILQSAQAFMAGNMTTTEDLFKNQRP
jgi:hypothetical protein